MVYQTTKHDIFWNLCTVNGSLISRNAPRAREGGKVKGFLGLLGAGKE